LNCLDLRRSFRPFFLDAKTSSPLPTKKYYDIASWLATQLTFSFAAAPFLLLGFTDSLTAWARVYFYAVVGTAGLMIFFASPAKKQLKKTLEKRSSSAKVGEGKEGLQRVSSSESLTGTGAPVLGISQDLEKELDEAFNEVREVRARARVASLSKAKKI
jgi:lysophospholipid acyltransferase